MVDAGFHFYERDLGAGGGVLAGALAFRLFLFAVPYVFVVITIFGSAADLQNESGQDAARIRRAHRADRQGRRRRAAPDRAARRSSASSSACSRSSSRARAVVKTLRAVHALAWRVPLTRLRNSTRAAALLDRRSSSACRWSSTGDRQGALGAARRSGFLARSLVDRRLGRRVALDLVAAPARRGTSRGPR